MSNYLDTIVFILIAGRVMPKLLPETEKLSDTRFDELVVVYLVKPETVAPPRLNG